MTDGFMLTPPYVSIPLTNLHQSPPPQLFTIPTITTKCPRHRQKTSKGQKKGSLPWRRGGAGGLASQPSEISSGVESFSKTNKRLVPHFELDRPNGDQTGPDIDTLTIRVCLRHAEKVTHPHALGRVPCDPTRQRSSGHLCRRQGPLPPLIDPGQYLPAFTHQISNNRNVPSSLGQSPLANRILR